jgi:hypothetical protein
MDGWIKKRKSRSAAAHFRVTSRRCAHHDVRDAARGERANTGEVFTQGAGGAGQHFQSGRASSASAFEAFQVFFEVPLTRVLHSWFMNRQKCIGYHSARARNVLQNGKRSGIEKPERADARTAERRTHATSVSSSVNVTTDSASE